MDYEESSMILGYSCTMLAEPDNAICGRIVGDYGNEIVVKLYDSKDAIYKRDELLIFD